MCISSPSQFTPFQGVSCDTQLSLPPEGAALVLASLHVQKSVLCFIDSFQPQGVEIVAHKSQVLMVKLLFFNLMKDVHLSWSTKDKNTIQQL